MVMQTDDGAELATTVMAYAAEHPDDARDRVSAIALVATRGWKWSPMPVTCSRSRRPRQSRPR
jgi:pimeloyl-ACP methyl ester carboxylesterase